MREWFCPGGEMVGEEVRDSLSIPNDEANDEAALTTSHMSKVRAYDSHLINTINTYNKKNITPMYIYTYIYT
jgi:hypothetical protein